MASLDYIRHTNPELAKHVEPVHEAFRNHRFMWHDNHRHLLYMLHNIKEEYSTMPLDKLYEFTKMFNVTYIRFNSVYNIVKMKNETNEVSDSIMDAFVNYYNELIDQLVTLDGDNVLEKHHLFKWE